MCKIKILTYREIPEDSDSHARTGKRMLNSCSFLLHIHKLGEGPGVARGKKMLKKNFQKKC